MIFKMKLQKKNSHSPVIISKNVTLKKKLNVKIIYDCFYFVILAIMAWNIALKVFCVHLAKIGKIRKINNSSFHC